MTAEFKSRLLYTQNAPVQIEQGEVNVSSSIYAIKFLYPGASQSTTGRIRITCTYKENSEFEAQAGVIEKWTDKGWIILDDYAGNLYEFISHDKFRKRLLGCAHSFIMGVPLESVDNGYVQDYSIDTTARKTKPRKISDFELKPRKDTIKKKTVEKDNYNIDASKDDDDDDIDWL